MQLLVFYAGYRFTRRLTTLFCVWRRRPIFACVRLWLAAGAVGQDLPPTEPAIEATALDETAGIAREIDVERALEGFRDAGIQPPAVLHHSVRKGLQ